MAEIVKEIILYFMFLLVVLIFAQINRGNFAYDQNANIIKLLKMDKQGQMTLTDVWKYLDKVRRNWFIILWNNCINLFIS